MTNAVTAAGTDRTSTVSLKVLQMSSISRLRSLPLKCPHGRFVAGLLLSLSGQFMFDRSATELVEADHVGIPLLPRRVAAGRVVPHTFLHTVRKCFEIRGAELASVGCRVLPPELRSPRRASTAHELGLLEGVQKTRQVGREMILLPQRPKDNSDSAPYIGRVGL